VMAGIETKNADATVAALGTDTVYTLLAPAGITVAPGTVKAYLGAPVVPSSDGSSSDASSSGSSSSSSDSSSGGGSNTGVIVGAVVGAVVGLGALGGGIWVSSARGGWGACCWAEQLLLQQVCDVKPPVVLFLQWV